MYWFTSDQHFSHSNILKYCNRPFETVDEMDKTIISNFNSKVKPNDIVYHLGDFSFKDPRPYLNQLNGKHHLIVGNHDNRSSLTYFKSVETSKLLKLEFGILIYLSHYGHRVWPSSHHGSIHLYGHSHGKLPSFGRSFDVGVDCNNFQPVSIEEVINTAKRLKPIVMFCSDPLKQFNEDSNENL